MLHPHLDAFLCVADCGSFSKAAERLFISPTAVMKQINALEERLSLPLFTRTPHGVRLTPAGETLYKDTRFIKDYTVQAIENARRTMTTESNIFRVGTSMLNPAKPFMDIWYSLGEAFPNASLKLVPFEDDHEGILATIARLGDAFDFLIGACESDIWLKHCCMLPLGKYRMMCGVPRGHRLAQKKRLEISDLYGETLLMVAEGDSETNDCVRHDLMSHHSEIRIEDLPHFYDISVFNLCANTGKILLTLECWQDVHPGIATIPVRWNYSIPYGLLYSLQPRPYIQEFVRTLEQSKKLSVE